MKSTQIHARTTTVKEQQKSKKSRNCKTHTAFRLLLLLLFLLAAYSCAARTAYYIIGCVVDVFSPSSVSLSLSLPLSCLERATEPVCLRGPWAWLAIFEKAEG